MNKKELITPFILVGLGLAFTVVSVAVFLSNGKSKKWVARKMKIGAILLTLTSAVACDPLITTCYDMPAPPNSMWMNGFTENGLELMLNTSNVLTGTIDERQSEKFSFAILDSTTKMVQNGLLIPVDGKFDTYSENFQIEIDTNISSGAYLLKLYDVDIEGQKNSIPRQEFNLLIKNE